MQKIKPSLLLYTAQRHQQCHQNSVKYGLFPPKFIQYSNPQALRRKQALCRNGAQKFINEIVWDLNDSPAIINGFVKKALRLSSNLRKLTVSFHFNTEKCKELQNFKIVIRKLLSQTKRIRQLKVSTKWYRKGNQISWKLFRKLRDLECFDCEFGFCNPSTSQAFIDFMNYLQKQRSWPKLKKQDLFLDFKPDLFEEVPETDTTHLLSAASKTLQSLDQATKFVPTYFYPVFSLIDQPQETDFEALAKSLENISDLKSLALGNVINRKSSHLLLQVPQFRRLRALSWHLSDNDTDAALDSLIPNIVTNNKLLQKLNLWIKNTSRTKFHNFTQQLGSLEPLTNLQLDFGTFPLLDDLLLTSLSTSLTQLTNLTDLKIMYNKSPQASSLTSSGLSLLLGGLESLSNLKGLFLSLRGHGKWISDEAAKMVGVTLGKLGKLEKVVLKLAANSIGEAGMMDLSLGLKKLRRLQMLELDLGRNVPISDEGVVKFCGNLKGLEWVSVLNVIIGVENMEYEKICGGLCEMIRGLKRLNEVKIGIVVDVSDQSRKRKLEELMRMFCGKIEILVDEGNGRGRFF